MIVRGGRVGRTMIVSGGAVEVVVGAAVVVVRSHVVVVRHRRHGRTVWADAGDCNAARPTRALATRPATARARRGETGRCIWGAFRVNWS